MPLIPPQSLSFYKNLKKLTTKSAGENAEQQELLYTVSMKAKWHSSFGKHFGGFLQN